MTTAQQINAETMAVNSALFRLQADGWRVISVNDGEEIISISEASSQLRARRKAVEAAYAVDVASITVAPIGNDADGVSLLVVWRNGAEDVLADFCGPSALVDRVEKVLDV